ncbi:hypothetical protein GCM10025873_10210 [Demequina sediminis]|nr:hypothetical protein GCM10025873_10210 [Demequina sediminis]
MGTPWDNGRGNPSRAPGPRTGVSPGVRKRCGNPTITSHQPQGERVIIAKDLEVRIGARVLLHPRPSKSDPATGWDWSGATAPARPP